MCRALHSWRQIGYLLKNRNFGCLIGPSYCMGAAVSVFFQRLQPSGLNWHGMCQLSNVKDPVAAALQSQRRIGYLLKNRNFGCLIGPSYCMGAAVSVFFQRMQPSGLNWHGMCQVSNVKDPVAAALQSQRQIGYLLKNRNFGCLIGPSYCMGAAVSVFFQRMQPSGLHWHGMCQLSYIKDPVAELLSPEDKLVIYLKIATLAAS